MACRCLPDKGAETTLRPGVDLGASLALRRLPAFHVGGEGDENISPIEKERVGFCSISTLASCLLAVVGGGIVSKTAGVHGLLSWEAFGFIDVAAISVGNSSTAGMITFKGLLRG